MDRYIDMIIMAGLSLPLSVIALLDEEREAHSMS
jgi:hypothetical protein